MEIIRFVNVVCAGLVTGAMVMELGLLIPVLRTTSHQALLEVHQGLSPRATKYIPIFGALTTIAGVVALFQHGISDDATILTIAALATWVAAVLTTYILYLPVTERMAAWRAEVVPPDRDSVIRRWVSTQAVRTAFFCAGFGLFVAAALAA